MAELIRITNTRPTLLHMPDALQVLRGARGQGNPDEQEIGPRIIGIGTGRSLNPGGNNVSRDDWDKVKGHHVVKEWLRLKWIEIGGDVAQPEGPLAPLNLAEYGEATASAMIEGEDSPEVLARWFKDESRPAVQAAIKRRIEALGAPAKGAKR